MKLVNDATSPRRLAEDLLDEQRDLSAASRFSEWHDQRKSQQTKQWYRELIPLSAPRPDQQYGFEVDLDKCSGCKACVSACHSLNGLDEDEAWREVGLLVSDDWRNPYQQTITTACHHCVDPACLNGCPVLAYDKDPATGIVRHLDDQCIGCQYCVLKCPYDVPKYSAKRGIVRKCDMCGSRLAVGEAPACAQACPSQAIRIVVVETNAIVRAFQHSTTSQNPFLPGSPAPDYTRPATRYRSNRSIPNWVRSADQAQLRPEPAHSPLVWMLVLTQCSAGLYLFDWILGRMVLDVNTIRPALSLAALTVGVGGVLASLFHLGRPWGAWRVFLGLRRSWLSREIVAFLFWKILAVSYAGVVWGSFSSSSGLPQSFLAATGVAGMVGVFCSAMVYHDTRREFWRWPATASKFFGTALILGGAAAFWLSTAMMPQMSLEVGLWPAAIIAGATLFKTAVEHRTLRCVTRDDFSSLHKTALILTGRFGLLNRWRLAFGILGGLIMPGFVLLGIKLGFQPARLSIMVGCLFLLCATGELIERWLFFTAVQPVKMPGTVAS